MTSAGVTRFPILAFGLLAALMPALMPAWAAGPGSLKFPDASLEPSSWSQLDGWAADDHATAYTTFLTSCRALLAQKAAPTARRFAEAMKAVCRRALAT